MGRVGPRAPASFTLQNDYRYPRFIATVAGAGYRFIPTFSNAGWAGASTTIERPRH